MAKEAGKLYWPLIMVTLVVAQQVAGRLCGQTTNHPAGLPAALDSTNQMEVIRSLLQRVEELEQKVRMLEAAQAQPQQTNKVKAAQEVQELSQKVEELEQQRLLDQEAQKAKVKSAPRISIGSDGFYIGSANGDFGLRLGGLVQMDSRTFFDDPAVSGNNELLLRRARPILQATFFRDFGFRLVPDFAPSSGPEIYDAYLSYTYSPELQFRAGKFKVPLGLERLVPGEYLFFNERALPSDLTPYRDVGFQVSGDLLDGHVSYAAGIFNGTRDGANNGNSDFANDVAFSGRVFLQPLRSSSATALQGVGFGLGGSYETMSTPSTKGLPSSSGGSVAGYLTAGQQQFFAYNPADGAVVLADDDHWRLAPQGYYYYGPLGLLGEYIISNQKVTREDVAPFSSAHLEHTAWQVSVSWILTGEEAHPLAGVVPAKPFDPTIGHWGAWQLVGRYGELNIGSSTFPLFSDPTSSARSAKAWAIGLNWYLNRNVQLKTSFSHTRFRGGGSGTSAPGTITHQDENALFTRVQVGF